MDVTRVATAHKALLCAAGLALTLGMATTSQAATVAPMTGYGLLDDESGVDILRVYGSAGESVYLDVYCNGAQIAKGYPWTLQDDGSGSLADVLVLGGIDMSALDAYTVEAFADPQGTASLGSYHLLPVYATLVEADGSSTVKLIGCTTEGVASGAPAVIATVQDGERYARVSDDGASLQYMNLDAVDAQGTIEYVLIDTQTGEQTVVARENVEIPGGQTVYWPIEDTIQVEYDGGTVSYQTHCNRGAAALSAQNPVFKVPVSSAFGSYTASISFVDESTGDVIMTDQVHVNRQNIYTAPRTFYRTDPTTGLVTTYNMVSDNVLTMDPSTQVTSYKVSYASEQPGEPVTWTVVLMNGVTGKEIGRVTQSVQPGQTATFQADDLSVEGQTLVPFGQTSYSYTYNQGEPLQYVYYVGEGYQPLEDYQVTVQYVDISTGAVLKSESIDVSPSMTSAITVAPGPQTMQVGGQDYVLLNGQTQPYSHSYYTPNRVYTFYYRNSADTAYESTVIVRTVVVDNGSTGVSSPQSGNAPVSGTTSGTQSSVTLPKTGSEGGLTVVTGQTGAGEPGRGGVATVGSSGLGVVTGSAPSSSTGQTAVVAGTTGGLSTVAGQGQAVSGVQGSAVIGSQTGVSAIAPSGQQASAIAQGPVSVAGSGGTMAVSGSGADQPASGQSAITAGQTGAVSAVSGSGAQAPDVTGTVVGTVTGSGVGTVSGSATPADATGSAVTASGGSYGPVRTGMENGSYTSVGTVAILDTSGTRTTETYEIIENQTPLAAGVLVVEESDSDAGFPGAIAAAVAAVAAGIAAIAAFVLRKKNPKAGS